MTDEANHAPLSPDKYNPIFETFVGAGDERDLTSLVAYSLYKKAKVQWTLKIKAEKKRNPTPEELIPTTRRGHRRRSRHFGIAHRHR